MQSFISFCLHFIGCWIVYPITDWVLDILTAQNDLNSECACHRHKSKKKSESEYLDWWFDGIKFLAHGRSSAKCTSISIDKIIRFQTDASVHLLLLSFFEFDWFLFEYDKYLVIDQPNFFFLSFFLSSFFPPCFSWKSIEEIAAIKSSKMTKNAIVVQAKNVNMIHAAIALHVN